MMTRETEPGWPAHADNPEQSAMGKSEATGMPDGRD